MAFNDPQDIRLDAAKGLADILISKSEATGGKKADLVDVVQFSDVADLLYPIGDPSGAGGPIGTITPFGGTAIGGGIKVSIDDLTQAAYDPTANRTGIVVFTDGQDDPPEGVTDTISEIKRAADMGIRVSFCFLSLDAANQNREILNGILESGGVYATVSSPSGIQTFLALILARGLTGIDASAAGSSNALIPGVATASSLSKTGSDMFVYKAKSGESFNITVTAIDPIDLKVVLRDTKANTELKSATTDTSGVAVISYTAKADMDLEVEVSAVQSGASGIFSIGIDSSNAPMNCTISPPNGNGGNVSVTPTSTPTPPVTQPPPSAFTGGVAALLQTWPNVVGAAFFSIFSFAVAAL
jgi:hypothetical protein